VIGDDLIVRVSKEHYTELLAQFSTRTFGLPGKSIQFVFRLDPLRSGIYSIMTNQGRLMFI